MRPVHAPRGFTLIETLVAVSLFSIIMVMTVGSLTILIDANRKARSEKAVINNLNASMEIISRSLRDGSGYICSPNPSCTGSNTQISFTGRDGAQVVFRVAGSAIERSVGGSSFVAITAPDVLVQNLSFTVISSSSEVPKFQITLRTSTPGEIATGAEFNLQTTVSQRFSYESPFSDAAPECGNGGCEWGENATNCASDCSLVTGGASCGNGQCEWGENATNCASDCVTSGTPSCTYTAGSWDGNTSQSPTCPFQAAPGQYIVDFASGDPSASSLYNNPNQRPDDLRHGPYTVSPSIPAGTYDVFAAAWDPHCNSSGTNCVADSQAFEQFYVQLYNGTTQLYTGSYNSGYVQDVPDNKNEGPITKIISDLVLNSSVNRVYTHHRCSSLAQCPDTPDGGGHSVYAACAAFVSKAGACSGATSNGGGDVMIVVDRSGSIGPTEFTEYKKSLKYFVNRVFAQNPDVRVGIIGFAVPAVLLSHLTSNQASLIAIIDAMTPSPTDGSGPIGSATNSPGGLRAALYEFQNRQETDTAFSRPTTKSGSMNDVTNLSPGYNRNDATNPNYVVLFTDGASNTLLLRTPTTVDDLALQTGDYIIDILMPVGGNLFSTKYPGYETRDNTGTTPAMDSLIAEADALKAAGIRVFVAGIAVVPNACNAKSCHLYLADDVASSPSDYYQTPDFDEAAMNAIADEIIGSDSVLSGTNIGGTGSTNTTCTSCPGGASCDASCVAPVVSQTTVTIDCTSCEGSGTCPAACVIPAIVSTTSRPIEIEEF